jgi:hypothetical protein
MGVVLGVVMDCLKYHQGPPCPNLLRPAACWWATPETALQPFQGKPARRAGGLWAVFYPFGHHTPHAYERFKVFDVIHNWGYKQTEGNITRSLWTTQDLEKLVTAAGKVTIRICQVRTGRGISKGEEDGCRPPAPVGGPPPKRP